MARFHVWIPDELAATVREELPDINVSAVVQHALRDLLGCDHDELICKACASPYSKADLIDAALTEFYEEALWKLAPLVGRIGTAEGACRILKDIAERWQGCGDFPKLRYSVRHTVLPRPSKRQREAARQEAWEEFLQDQTRQAHTPRNGTHPTESHSHSAQ